MSKDDFTAATALLAGQGLVVADARYDYQVFGSWFIELATSPALRLVWDGRDGSLVVQRKTDKIFSGLPVWHDVWLDKRPQDMHAALREAAAQIHAIKS